MAKLITNELKTKEVILKSPNGLVEKTVAVGNDGVINFNSINITEQKPLFWASTKDGSNSVTGLVTYSLVNVNIGNGFNPSTSKFTAPISGYYYFYAHALSHTSANSLHIKKNGTQITQSAYMQGLDTQMTVSCIVYLNVGDYVQVYTQYEHYENAYGEFNGFFIR